MAKQPAPRQFARRKRGRAEAGPPRTTVSLPQFLLAADEGEAVAAAAAAADVDEAAPSAKKARPQSEGSSPPAAALGPQLRQGPEPAPRASEANGVAQGCLSRWSYTLLLFGNVRKSIIGFGTAGMNNFALGKCVLGGLQTFSLGGLLGCLRGLRAFIF